VLLIKRFSPFTIPVRGEPLSILYANGLPNFHFNQMSGVILQINHTLCPSQIVFISTILKTPPFLKPY
jgi:hypothetical protein